MTGDDFERADTTGWTGPAEDVQWTLSGVPSSAARLESGRGLLELQAGETGTALLPAAEQTDTVLETEFVVDGENGTEGAEVGIIARATADDRYLVSIVVDAEGAVSLRVRTGEKEIGIAELDEVELTPDTSYTFQVSVSGAGPTTLSAKLWETGSQEPTAWQYEVVDDSSDLQSTGAIGLMGAHHDDSAESITVRFDRFEVVTSA